MTILVIEDNKEILGNIAEYLSMKGYTVDCAQDGLTGLHLLSSKPYELLVLDVMLPGVDGFGICTRLRQDMKSDIPVIMLTAKDTLEDRLEGFRAGVDDYLVKPFALSELIVRIVAVLRRYRGGSQHCLRVEDVVFDLDRYEVTRAGGIIRLNPTAMKLLEILMRKSPGVVRRNVLEEALWADDLPDSDSLRSHIHQLRKSIDKPFEKPLIQTVHSIGYSLRA